MPTSSSGITYFVRNADGRTNYKESWHPGVNQATAIIQCPWNGWPDLRRDLLGTCQWNGTTLSRTLPMSHPKNPWMPCVAAELVEVIGTPTDNGDIGDFDESDDDNQPIAVAAVTYQSVLYDLLTDEQIAAGSVGELGRYVLRQPRYGLELLEMPGVWLEYSDTPGPRGTIGSGAKSTKPYPNEPLVYSWLRVPSSASNSLPNYFPKPLWTNIQNCVGRVNADTFDGVYEPGTVLCGCPDIEQQVGPTGDIEFQLKYNFTRHSTNDLKGGITNSWNVKYRRTDQFGVTAPGLYPIQIAQSGGDTPYRYGDFSSLFKNG